MCSLLTGLCLKPYPVVQALPENHRQYRTEFGDAEQMSDNLGFELKGTGGIVWVVGCSDVYTYLSFFEETEIHHHIPFTEVSPDVESITECPSKFVYPVILEQSHKSYFTPICLAILGCIHMSCTYSYIMGMA